MHLLIPYAASHHTDCLAMLPSLNLPHVQKLLPQLDALPLDAGDELSFSPPHERALAAGLGLPSADGQIPWAAWQAQQQAELAHLPGAWAWVTLCHWQATAHQVTLRQLPMQDLLPAESTQLLAAMQPFFNEDGLTLYPHAPGHWLACGQALADLRCASPDRVLGRNLEPWMPQAHHASSLIRLMSEMQMLLYNHPVNDARERRGTLPVNAFWLSGTGTLPHPSPAPKPVAPTVVNTLRQPALAADWQSWAQAWQTLDAQHGQALLQAHAQGQAVQLTLCGERHAQTWRSQPRTLWQKVQHLFGTQRLSDLLKQL